MTLDIVKVLTNLPQILKYLGKMWMDMISLFRYALSAG